MSNDAFTRAAADKHDMLFAAPTREARIALMEIAFRAAGQEHFAPTLYAWAMHANALQQRLVDEGITTGLPAPPYADTRAAGVLALARVWAGLCSGRWQGPEIPHRHVNIDALAMAANLLEWHPEINAAMRLTPTGEALRDLGQMLAERTAHAVRQAEPASQEA